MNIVYDIASITTMYDNNSDAYYSLVPAQTAANITSAIIQDGVTFVFYESTSTDPIANTTVVVQNYVVSTLPLPSAAATLILTQSDVAPPPNATFGLDELDQLYIDPVTPSIVVPAANPTPFTATATTNVVYYTAYEVEYMTPTTGADGSMSCATVDSTYMLNGTYAYEYDDLESTLGSELVATGTLDPGFLAVIPQSTCTAGTFIAPEPTMLVILEVTYQRGIIVFLVHQEISTTGVLVAATTSTDSGSAPSPPGDGNGSNPGKSGSSGDSSGNGRGGSGGVSVGLGVANLGGTRTTLQVTFTGGQQSATVTVGGQTVVATAADPGDVPAIPDEESSGGSGGRPTGSSNSQTVTIGNGNVQIAPEANGAVAVGGQTIQPGQSATVNGVPVSVPANGGAIVINGPGGPTTAAVQQAGSSPPPPVIAVGNQDFTANAATQYYLAPGQTLTPGGMATVNGEVVSLAPNADYVIVNGQTENLGASSPAVTPPPINIGGNVYQANAQGAYIVQGQTLTPGGEIFVSGNLISLGNGYNSLVVNGVTITSPPVAIPPTAEPAITLGGSTYLANPGGESFIISGQTLTPGGVITAHGTTVSLDSGSTPTIAVVNGQTETLDYLLAPPTVVVGGTPYTESSGTSFVIAGQTVRPGQTITVFGTTVAVASSGSYIVINGVTSQLTQSTIPVIEIGGTSFAATFGPSDAYIIGGQTLYPGGPAITYMGSTISLLPSGTAIVVNGKTTYLQYGTTTNPPLITFDGTVFTANAGTTFLIDGQTLTPGGIITIDGTIISLSPSATAVVINGKTTTLFPATTTTPNPVSATVTTTAAATGSGVTRDTASSTKMGAANASRTPLGTIVVAAAFSALTMLNCLSVISTDPHYLSLFSLPSLRLV